MQFNDAEAKPSDLNTRFMDGNIGTNDMLIYGATFLRGDAQFYGWAFGANAKHDRAKSSYACWWILSWIIYVHVYLCIKDTHVCIPKPILRDLQSV